MADDSAHSLFFQFFFVAIEYPGGGYRRVLRFIAFYLIFFQDFFCSFC